MQPILSSTLNKDQLDKTIFREPLGSPSNEFLYLAVSKAEPFSTTVVIRLVVTKPAMPGELMHLGVEL